MTREEITVGLMLLRNRPNYSYVIVEKDNNQNILYTIIEADKEQE